MCSNLLHRVISQYRTRFRAHFSALNDGDVAAILEGTDRALLAVLHRRYGYSPSEAKAAWNEFVMRYVDGAQNPVRHVVRNGRMHRNVRPPRTTHNRRLRRVV